MSIQIEGYHGTLLSKAEQILDTQYFRPSTKNIEWLGKGVYFFAYKRHAQDWAKGESEKSRNNGEKYAVLKATLCFEESHLLDMDDPDQLDQVNQLVEKAIIKSSASVNSPKADTRKAERLQRWCFACNFYRKINTDVGVTMYTFVKRYKGNEYPYTQRQICISDNKIINKIEREV